MSEEAKEYDAEDNAYKSWKHCVEACRKIGLARGYYKPQEPELEWLAEFRMTIPYMQNKGLSQVISEVDERLRQRQLQVKFDC